VEEDRARDLLAAPIGLRLLEQISRREAAELTDPELGDLLLEAGHQMSRFRGDYDADVARLKAQAANLAGLARWVTQRMPQWWDDLDTTKQVWVGRSPEPPDEARFKVDLSPFDLETPKPKLAFWTCTRIETFLSPWLESPEKMPFESEGVWMVTASRNARVAEIHSPAAWSDFVRTYPRAEPGYTYVPMYVPMQPRPDTAARLDPDWAKVAQDWDGVHLSTGGWLGGEDVTFRSGETATELRAWNMESTVWLRWRISSFEPWQAA